MEVDAKFSLRLHELGIRPGAEVVAVSRAAFGGLVLNVAGTRIAVDHRSAKHIHVEPVEGPKVISKSEVSDSITKREPQPRQAKSVPTPAV